MNYEIDLHKNTIEFGLYSIEIHLSQIHLIVLFLKLEPTELNVLGATKSLNFGILLHFHNRVTAMKREEYQKAIESAINKKGNHNSKKEFKYKKIVQICMLY